MLQGFKRRLFTQIGVALGLIMVFAIFIILLNLDINKRELSIEGSKQEIALRNQTIDLLSSSNSDLKKAEPLLENLKTILPSQDQLIGFPEELGNLAKSYGVDIGFEWRKGGVIGTDVNPGTILFGMSLSGAYSDISAFMGALERHRYFIRIEGIEVLRTGTAPNTFSLKAAGTIYTN